MKFFVLLLCFGILASAAPPRILQILRVLSEKCNEHGVFFQNKCFCINSYTGSDCSQRKGQETSDKLNLRNDDIYNRLDDLYNISPEHYLLDDDEFPRMGVNSNIFGEETKNTEPWIKMHDMTKNFQIFSRNPKITDLFTQNSDNGYLLAAFASLINRENGGALLKNMFVDLNDNPKHVYVTRWFIQGKPRYVAVDDWVPGDKATQEGKGVMLIDNGKRGEGDFWPLILEKAFAKIYGSYASIRRGSAEEVWSAVTEAISFEIPHSDKNNSALFDFIKDLLKKNYPVATQAAEGNSLGQYLFYSVLGVYEITTDNGAKVQLVRYYSPKQLEWEKNPWGDNSSNWTAHTKSQVPYINKNDGIAFITIQDYSKEFGWTQWAEIQNDYDVSFIELAFNGQAKENLTFEFNFTYDGDASEDFYIFLDWPNWRMLGPSNYSVQLFDFEVFAPRNNGKQRIYSNDYEGSSYTNLDKYYRKITNPIKGNYTVKFLAWKYSYVKSFVITAYAKKGKLNFIAPPNNTIVDDKKKLCPNNCNLHGRCNTVYGNCSCHFGYKGNDCNLILDNKCEKCSSPNVCDPIFGTCVKPNEKKTCPMNCNNNGVCSVSTGTCVCNTGRTGDGCNQIQKTD